MECGRSAAGGSFQSAAAWQEAEQQGSAELFITQNRESYTSGPRDSKTAFNPKRYHKIFLKGRRGVPIGKFKTKCK